jgi:hypothetical protein
MENKSEGKENQAGCTKHFQLFRVGITYHSSVIRHLVVHLEHLRLRRRVLEVSRVLHNCLRGTHLRRPSYLTALLLHHAPAVPADLLDSRPLCRRCLGRLDGGVRCPIGRRQQAVGNIRAHGLRKLSGYGLLMSLRICRLRRWCRGSLVHGSSRTARRGRGLRPTRCWGTQRRPRDTCCCGANSTCRTGGLGPGGRGRPRMIRWAGEVRPRSGLRSGGRMWLLWLCKLSDRCRHHACH